MEHLPERRERVRKKRKIETPETRKTNMVREGREREGEKERGGGERGGGERAREATRSNLPKA